MTKVSVPSVEVTVILLSEIDTDAGYSSIVRVFPSLDKVHVPELPVSP
jgi:hypothetical protein